MEKSIIDLFESHPHLSECYQIVELLKGKEIGKKGLEIGDVVLFKPHSDIANVITITRADYEAQKDTQIKTKK